MAPCTIATEAKSNVAAPIPTTRVKLGFDLHATNF